MGLNPFLRGDSIGPPSTGRFPFKENQAGIRTETIFFIFFSYIQMYAGIKAVVLVTTAWKNLHCSLPTLYLSSVDKTKLSSRRTVTIKVTRPKEMKQPFTKSTGDTNKQFYCRYLCSR